MDPQECRKSNLNLYKYALISTGTVHIASIKNDQVFFKKNIPVWE